MGKLGYKGLLLLGGMMMLGGAAQAQYLRSSYFMEGTSARLQLNPGLQPTKGYFNMPIIGSLNMSASSNVLQRKRIKISLTAFSFLIFI